MQDVLGESHAVFTRAGPDLRLQTSPRRVARRVAAKFPAAKFPAVRPNAGGMKLS